MKKSRFSDSQIIAVLKQVEAGTPSYRSAIYYANDAQRRSAPDTIADVDTSGFWPGKVVTQVEPVGDFREAEPEHQDYLDRFPNAYTCHFPRVNWVLQRGKQLSKTQHLHRAACPRVQVSGMLHTNGREAMMSSGHILRELDRRNVC